MTRRSLMLVLAAALAGPAIAVPSGTEADHVALRQLKNDAVRAINARDFARARQLTHEPFLATPLTQNSFNDFDKLVAFYRSLYTTDSWDRPKMANITMALEADELSQIYTGTFAVTRGGTQERYDLADGRSFEMGGRWTGVSIKEGGQWKILAVHTGTNFLDNPVLKAWERAATWGTAGGLALGLLVGALFGWFIKGRQGRAAAG